VAQAKHQTKLISSTSQFWKGHKSSLVNLERRRAMHNENSKIIRSISDYFYACFNKYLKIIPIISSFLFAKKFMRCRPDTTVG
jgi:hypothetical protein